MLQSLHLKGVGPSPEMGLDFAPRLNLLTGDNGLGKSFVLDIAWWALTRTWAGSPAWPREEASVPPRIGYEIWGRTVSAEGWHTKPVDLHSTYSFEEGRWPLPEGDLFSLHGLVLYAKVDGSFSVWDSVRNVYNRPGGEAMTSNSFSHWAYHFSPQSLWDGLSESNRVLSEGLIRDWVAWQRQQTAAFLQLREILTVLSPDGEELRPGEPTRVDLDDVRDHPTLEMPYGKVPLVFASAGMKRVLSLAYLLVWAWQEHLEAAKLRRRPPADHIVFLIDEIDSHLHPKWQRLILPALLKAAEILRKDVDVQVFVTTHSPLVLASAEPIFDEEKDALFTFDLEGRDVRVAKADWRTRGDASAWLTSEIFDLGEARSVEAEHAIQQAMEAMRADLPIEEKRKVHRELHAVLKDTDPFWGRWLVQAKAAGIEP